MNQTFDYFVSKQNSSYMNMLPNPIQKLFQQPNSDQTDRRQYENKLTELLKVVYNSAAAKPLVVKVDEEFSLHLRLLNNTLDLIWPKKVRVSRSGTKDIKLKEKIIERKQLMPST